MLLHNRNNLEYDGWNEGQYSSGSSQNLGNPYNLGMQQNVGNPQNIGMQQNSGIYNEVNCQQSDSQYNTGAPEFVPNQTANNADSRLQSNWNSSQPILNCRPLT